MQKSSIVGSLFDNGAGIISLGLCCQQKEHRSPAQQLLYTEMHETNVLTEAVDYGGLSGV